MNGAEAFIGTLIVALGISIVAWIIRVEMRLERLEDSA